MRRFIICQPLYFRKSVTVYSHLGFSEILFSRANVTNLPNFPNWPWPMKEIIHLIGSFIGHVCQYDPFKCFQILNMSNVWHEKFKWFNPYHWYSFNGWTQMFQVPVFKQIRHIHQICQKEFQKTSIILLNNDLSLGVINWIFLTCHHNLVCSDVVRFQTLYFQFEVNTQ